MTTFRVMQEFEWASGMVGTRESYSVMPQYTSVSVSFWMSHLDVNFALSCCSRNFSIWEEMAIDDSTGILKPDDFFHFT